MKVVRVPKRCKSTKLILPEFEPEEQIAIWETVAPKDFKLNGTNDYGASTLLASLQTGGINAGIAPANLVALSSGKNQDYVVQYVPDAGTTLVLLGLGLVAMAVVGRKTRSVSTTTS